MEIIKQTALMLRFPADAFYRMKHKAKTWYGVLFYLLICIVRLAQVYLTNEPLAGVLPKDAHIIIECSKFLLPLLSWALVSYAIASIQDGECTLRLSFVSTGYCMLPYLIFTLPVALLSHILSQGDRVLYQIIQAFIWIWIILLFIKQVMETNNYTLGKTIKVIFLSLFTVLVLWAVIVILYLLLMNLYHFLQEIWSDILYLLKE